MTNCLLDDVEGSLILRALKRYSSILEYRLTRALENNEQTKANRLSNELDICDDLLERFFHEA